MGKILLNAVRCKKCGETIVSEYTHDFKYCKCKTVAVDGGHEYIKRIAYCLGDYEELSKEEVETP